MFCTKCGAQMDDKAAFCVSCGTPVEGAPQKKKSVAVISGIIGALFFLFYLFYFFGGGLEDDTAHEMRKIEVQVAQNALEQYSIAKKNGSPMDACVQAGLVKAAYLQAKDEGNYKQWQDIEKADCERAGLIR